MLPLFGILRPQTGPETISAEAPRKKSFFGGPVDPAVVAPLAEEDALYLADKQPEPDERERLARRQGPGRIVQSLPDGQTADAPRT